MEQHIPNLLAAVWILGLCAVVFYVAKLVRPARKNPEAISGVIDTVPTPVFLGFRKLLVLAILVSAALLLLFPVATVFREKAMAGSSMELLSTVIVFCVIICLAVAHAWIKGDLNWLSQNTATVSKVGNELNGDSRKHTA